MRRGKKQNWLNKIAARVSQTGRENVGPTVFTLARKAEIWGCGVTFQDGRVQIASRKVKYNGHELTISPRAGDAENPLLVARSAEFITEPEFQAGEKFVSLRRQCFGLGVVRAPAFYRHMVSGDPEERAQDAVGELLTDAERLERALEVWQHYEEAFAALRRSERLGHRVLWGVSTGGWPESGAQWYQLRRAVRWLAGYWRMG